MPHRPSDGGHNQETARKDATWCSDPESHIPGLEGAPGQVPRTMQLCPKRQSPYHWRALDALRARNSRTKLSCRHTRGLRPSSIRWKTIGPHHPDPLAPSSILTRPAGRKGMVCMTGVRGERQTRQRQENRLKRQTRGAQAAQSIECGTLGLAWVTISGS